MWGRSYQSTSLIGPIYIEPLNRPFSGQLACRGACRESAELMDGAMQQAPQPGRQIIGSSSGFTIKYVASYALWTSTMS